MPRLTRQPPCFLLFPSILFAPRMYPIIYKSFVDGIFSMKVKKYASRSEKNNFDRFRIIPRYRLYVYMRYLIIIRTRIVYIHYIYSNSTECIHRTRPRFDSVFISPSFRARRSDAHSELAVVQQSRRNDSHVYNVVYSYFPLLIYFFSLCIFLLSIESSRDRFFDNYCVVFFITIVFLESIAILKYIYIY